MGEIIKAEIGEMNLMGNGITKRDGCVVFCLGAVDGDEVTAEITQHKKNFKIAEIISVDKESEHRCDSGCAIYKNCGGCDLRHIKYEHELDIKHKNIENAFRRAGLSDIKVDEIIYAGAEKYRNKVVFHFSANGELGYMENGTHNIIEFDECMLCPDEFIDIAKWTREYFSGRTGDFTYLFIRGNNDNSEINVVLGLKNKKTDGIKEFADGLTSKFECVTGVLTGLGEHPEENNNFKCIYGVPYVNAEFCGLDVKVSAASFFQVNYQAAQLLAEKVAEMASPKVGEYGADLYCGTGILGLVCADRFPASFITGVEINEKAVADAKENAQMNGLMNLGYYAGDSADFVKGAYGSIDFAIIDPPRSGCSDKMIKELVRLKPQRIVSVSCAPETLARDMKKLTEKGYDINKVVACDLFPRTKHVETVVLLSRNK